jgi:hypothetical protein
MREWTTLRMMAADWPYDELYDFYSASVEYFGYTLVQRHSDLEDMRVCRFGLVQAWIISHRCVFCLKCCQQGTWKSLTYFTSVKKVRYSIRVARREFRHQVRETESWRCNHYMWCGENAMSWPLVRPS